MTQVGDTKSKRLLVENMIDAVKYYVEIERYSPGGKGGIFTLRVAPYRDVTNFKSIIIGLDNFTELVEAALELL